MFKRSKFLLLSQIPAHNHMKHSINLSLYYTLTRSYIYLSLTFFSCFTAFSTFPTVGVVFINNATVRKSWIQFFQAFWMHYVKTYAAFQKKCVIRTIIWTWLITLTTFPTDCIVGKQWLKRKLNFKSRTLCQQYHCLKHKSTTCIIYRHIQ